MTLSPCLFVRNHACGRIRRLLNALNRQDRRSHNHPHRSPERSSELELKQLKREIVCDAAVACVAMSPITAPCCVCCVLITMLAVHVVAVHHSRSDQTAQSLAMRGLTSFSSGDLQTAVPLLQQAVQANPHDWVALEYLGGAYGMAARRVAAQGRGVAGAQADGADFGVGEVERQALNAAVQLFSRAHGARSRHQVSPLHEGRAVSARAAAVGVHTDGSSEGSADYPQLQYARRQSLMLRGWGDALALLGRRSEARAVFQLGVDAGIWQSALCRPDVLQDTALPVGTFFAPRPAVAHVTAPLEALIPVASRELDESLRRAAASKDGLHSQGWDVEGAGLHASRSWHVLPLMVNGALTPACQDQWTATCKALSALPELRLRDGQVKVSLMLPGTVVRPHAGPTNGRLRAHCPLRLPPGGMDVATFRVGNDVVTWEEGQCLVFDESCEHEVHVMGHAEGPRVVLLVDFANPFLSSEHDYIAALNADSEGAVLGHRQFYRSFANIRASARAQKLGASP